MQQMKVRILDLGDRQALILNDNDREFILGLVMLIEMDEPIDAQYIQRVNSIYAEVQGNETA